MRILWHSTAPWSPSSYSVLTARAVPGIVKAGHQVAIGTWYGLQGQPLPWTIQDKKTNEVVARVDVFPAGNGEAFSQDILVQLYKYLKAQVAIVCSDVWPFKNDITKDILFAPWLPIDHDPAPAPVLNALETAVYPMTYSKWGQRVLADAGVKAAYVPCSAPSDMFKPGDKKAARQALGIIDKAKYIVGVIAANKDPQDRKGFSEALQAFAKFAEAHEGAFLYLHTDVNGPINALAIAESLGIRKRIIQCDPLGYKLGMLDTGYMINAYNACDVLLNLAKSEGFGLPILEAQMCGVPVIATDFSTTDELMWAGWKVGGQPHWSPGQDSWRITADIGSAVDALEEAYKNRNNKTLKQQARRGAISLSTDRVFSEYWQPALVAIEQIVDGGQKVYDFAKDIDMAPSQEFGAIADRIAPNDEVSEPEHFHKWAKIGISQNGNMCIPCLNGDDCESELRIDSNGRQSINEGAFSPVVDGYHLKIEDAPEGGVSKIIIRELTESYHLDKMKFDAGDVIIDIGAHVGIASIYLGLKHPDTIIYAYEPDPENYTRLLRNLKRNGATNVMAINKAVVGSPQGFAKLFTCQSINSGGGTLYGNENAQNGFTMVKTITLSEIFDAITECALLKIDCEGAEYEIFNEAPLDLLRRIKRVVGEFHTGDGLPSPQALAAKLSEFTEIEIGGISAIS